MPVVPQLAIGVRAELAWVTMTKLASAELQQFLHDAHIDGLEAISPIINIDYSTYTTIIGAGSPSRNFNAIVDIA